MATRRRQAAEWLLILEDPDVPAGELLQWEAWMNRSARNRRAFDELEQLSRRMQGYRDALKDIPIPSRQECEADTGSGSGFVARRVADRAGAALGRAWNQMTEQPAWTRRTATLASIAVILASLVFLIRPVILDPEEASLMQIYRTAVSEHRSIALPDGSAIAMGAKSSLSVNFSPEERIVMLESGEALFEVADEGGRPFIVMAGAGTITALGTTFNVRRDADRVVVTVTEGRVEVKRTPQGIPGGSLARHSGRQLVATTIGVGDQAVVSATELSIVELKDPEAVTEWQTGHLYYRAEPLRFVVAGVSRYSAKEIIIVDRDIENMLFTGSVYQDQTDDWLDALEAVFPVEIAHEGYNKVLIRRRQLPMGD